MIVTKYLSDGATNAVKRIQDCEPIMEDAKARQRAGLVGNDYRHVMRVPAVIVERYCNQKGITFADFMEDEAHMRAIADDPDLSYFRVWTGRM